MTRNNNSHVGRRDLLKQIGVAGAATLFASKVSGASECLLTAAQPEGPFYPVTPRRDSDSDLTVLAGETLVAKGEHFILNGSVQSAACLPISNAIVEIWQACASGKYDHPSDANPAEFDPRFQYWGRAITDAQGRYSFRTVVPGAYRASDSWIRPPHIHFRVTAPGARSFTTQMYFERFAELNAQDRILSQLTAQQRSRVIVRFERTPPSLIASANFDVILNLRGAADLTPELD